MKTETPTPDALLDGAMEQFATHGFMKTSMSDIAKAAGISRTSLYKHFSTKEEVFKALSNRINARVIESVVTAYNKLGPWDQRLLEVIHARVSWVYDLLHSSEFGRELINEKNRVCGGEVLAANDRFQALISEMLAEDGVECPNPEELAALLIQSVNGVLDQAETKAGARSSIALLVRVFAKSVR